LPRTPASNGRKKPRRDVASQRRREIVEAAVAVIAEQGVQHLSLSEIEKRAGMARGQLTYYFPTKEGIFLAVFDHLLGLMYQRIGTPRGPVGNCEEAESGWEWVCHLLDAILLHPPASPEFHCLQYTFLSQIGHREDFRRRLAQLYEEWRGNLTSGLARDLAAAPAAPEADPRLVASLVQAILHGLSMQLAADPQAFDRQAMFRLCCAVLGGFFHLGPPRPADRNGAARGSRSRAPKTPSDS
jgi:AcrR family transcriptional regulator